MQTGSLVITSSEDKGENHKPQNDANAGFKTLKTKLANAFNVFVRA